MQALRQLKKIFNNFHPDIAQKFKEIYGDRPEFIQQQAHRYARILDEFGRIYGSEHKVVIARAPARINLVGMHVDHRGGSVNPIASNEIRIVASRREDDQVVLHNLNPRFPPRRFSISHQLPPEKITDWAQWTQEQSDERKRQGTTGDWSNYVKAALLYLQEVHRADDGRYIKRISGMNIFVDGDIQLAAGLGSSSALVVASAEEAVAINDLNISPNDLVDLCGTAEWYIGTRGGKGDHAAIKLSKQGFISTIGFFPLTVDYAPFPGDYRVVVCNSLVEAKKAAGAKSIFNERVAAYEIGMMLLKHRFSMLNGQVKHLRDLNAENLSVDEAYLYELIKSLPLRISREQLNFELPFHTDDLQKLYQTHDEPEEGYRVRGVCMFGLAECERSKKAAEFLHKGDIAAFGQLISFSHEGDRISVRNGSARIKMEAELDDKVLDQLIEARRSGNLLQAENALLYKQPGGYAVSCEALDTLVDIASNVNGVLGAGRIGAGLGGCISALVEADRVQHLIQTVTEEYYQPRNLPTTVEVCFPVAGAGVLKVEG
jgi:N-acetylgalactosamine kinase